MNNLDIHVACPPPLPSKHHRIDVNREFELCTTEYLTYSAEAPPVYQQDQTSDPPWTPTFSDPPKFVLKTIARERDQPLGNSPKQDQHTSEARRPLRAPRIEPAAKNPNRLQAEPIRDITEEQPCPSETTVLCQLPGASMDFTQPDNTMPGRMGLVKGASTCIFQISSRTKRSASKGTRVVRSIWTIAEDGKSRIQQKLPRDCDTIPYTLWSNLNKVVIRHPTELRYYKDANSASPYKTTETSWVTYTFDSASQSSEFQSSLLRPLQLIKSFPTSRTMRLHPSPFTRAFCPRLQLCALENLRIFRDTTDPNCLVCMIHYSPNFHPSNGEEYIIFRLYPPPRNSVRIREDGESCVKIKGLDIRGCSAGEQAKKAKSPQSQTERLEEEAYGSHSIEKIKIQFDSGQEKREFLQMTRELQGLSSW
ncbi:MAG: hypothetical protein Q9178_002530 [Gyalolechia marmorata]